MNISICSCQFVLIYYAGHPQQEHETSHGSMSRTQWTIDGPDGTVVELDGRKFGTNDEGAPMLCSLYCGTMGRHVHVDYCRTDANDVCGGSDHEHITKRMHPNPDRTKDWISHDLYWRRTGIVYGDRQTFTTLCSFPLQASKVVFSYLPSRVQFDRRLDPYSQEEKANFALW